MMTSLLAIGGGICSIGIGIARMMQNHSLLSRSYVIKREMVNGYEVSINSNLNRPEINIDCVYANYNKKSTTYVNVGGKHMILIPMTHTYSESDLVCYGYDYDNSFIKSFRDIELELVDSNEQKEEYIAKWKSHPDANMVAKYAHQNSIRVESITIIKHHFAGNRDIYFAIRNNKLVAITSDLKKLLSYVNPSTRYHVIGSLLVVMGILCRN